MDTRPGKVMGLFFKPTQSNWLLQFGKTYRTDPAEICV